MVLAWPHFQVVYVADGCTDYGALDSLIGGVVNLRVIEENGNKVLRMAASIRAVTVLPLVMMRRWAAYPGAPHETDKMVRLTNLMP